MSERESLVYLNGTFVPAAEARVSVYDSAFLHGMAVFETVRIDAARVPHELDLHLARLWEGCRRLRVVPKLKGEDVRAVLRELVERNGLAPCRGRIMISRGPDAESGLSGGPTELVLLLPQPVWPAEYRVRSVVVDPGYLSRLPVVKSSNRIESILLTE